MRNVIATVSVVGKGTRPHVRHPLAGDLKLAAEKGRKRRRRSPGRRGGVPIRFYLRCGLIYRRSGSRIRARALATHYIFPTNRTEVHVGKYIGRVPLHRRDGRSEGAGSYRGHGVV